MLTPISTKAAPIKVSLDEGLKLAVLLDEMTEAQALFLSAFVFSRSQDRALDYAGLTSIDLINGRLTKPRFDEMFRAAEMAVLESELWTRAVEGTAEPITFQGVITATWKRKSDALLKLLLASRNPNLYGEKQEIRVEKNVTVTHAIAGGEKIAAHWKSLDDETDAAMRDLDRLLPAPKPAAIDAEFTETETDGVEDV
jgi:hypothetical protein